MKNGVIFGYIYKTTNLLNNRVYIGKKKGKFVPNYYGSGIYLKRAINKYGKDGFQLSVLIYAENRNKLNELERHYISEYRKRFGKENLYNISDGGDGRFCPMSIKSRKKISLNHAKYWKGKTLSKKTRRKISESTSLAIKRKWKEDAEYRKNIISARLGRKRGKYNV